jgi:hypothetical protein
MKKLLIAVILLLSIVGFGNKTKKRRILKDPKVNMEN